MDSTPLPTQTIMTPAELVELGATDSLFFYRTFFPKTCRQGFADFHPDVSDTLDDPLNRYVNLLIFRGGAKTSICRMFTAKRIAYGLSHTILYISKSEGHAARSIRWIKGQIERNKLFAETFKLRPGGKWQDTEAEIIHGVDEYPIWIMASGILGSVRGVNQDDFRPDLEVLDDVLDDENCASDDQRNKINRLVYGAVMESLAPEVDSPDAKLISLNTPQNKEDYACQALKDPTWVSKVYGCWTHDTRDLEVSDQVSSWESRNPTAKLRQEKENAIAANRLSTFLREKECKLTNPETSAFRPEWLRRYKIVPPRNLMTIVYSIDPVPPPSEIQIAKGMVGKDYEAHAVLGRMGNDIYLLEYRSKRGHDPSWSTTTFFELIMKYNPRKAIVESVAYQRTLVWILKKAMETFRRWVPIFEMVDKRSKYDRIVDGLNGISSAGHFFVRDEHIEFISQFESYPDVSHDDVLEAVAVAATELQGLAFSSGGNDNDAMTLEDEKDIPALEYKDDMLAP